MLDSFQFMIYNDSESIQNFFKDCIYQPPLMQEDIIIPWPEGKTRIQFVSETSIITEKNLKKHIFPED